MSTIWKRIHLNLRFSTGVSQPERCMTNSSKQIWFYMPIPAQCTFGNLLGFKLWAENIQEHVFYWTVLDSFKCEGPTYFYNLHPWKMCLILLVSVRVCQEVGPSKNNEIAVDLTESEPFNYKILINKEKLNMYISRGTKCTGAQGNLTGPLKGTRTNRQRTLVKTRKLTL